MVFIGGKDVMTLSAREMAKEVAVMAQENPVGFDVDVIDMVMFGRYPHRRFLARKRRMFGCAGILSRRWGLTDMSTDPT